ncbi:MAG: helix-turn-helix domain-containing protein [Bdellovibrionales bacterium]
MINKEIRALRLRQDFTQEKLAQLSKVSLPTIQNIEAGRANPSLLILEKILDALGAKLKISINKPTRDVLSLFNTDEWEFQKSDLSEIIILLTQRYDLKTIVGRELDLLVSLFIALQDHYSVWLKTQNISPSTFNILQQRRVEIDPNRLIKFRRIWLSKISTVI